MCNNEQNTCENCLSDILKVILLLQKNACRNDTCLQSCDRGYLGQNNMVLSNTRPVVLYTYLNDGSPLAMPTSRDITVTDTSIVFRIEKLDGCCATFRVLAPNTDNTSNLSYLATDSFFTINLNSVCVLRCLDDTFVDTI